MAVSIDLSGRVAIVTGGARGFGRSVAEKLVEAGAQVVIADVLSVEEWEWAPIVDGAVPVYEQVDLSQEPGCTNLVRRVADRFGQVDVLVNNAAISKGGFTKVFEVNVLAPYWLNEAVFAHMAARGSGRIVNITTSGTFSGGGDGVAYNATKGALDSMTRYQARRFAAQGVSVNAVAPGPMLTDMMEAYFGRESFESHYQPQMPSGQVLTTAEVTGTVLFLCSDLSAGLCGETLLADAGRVRLSPW